MKKSVLCAGLLASLLLVGCGKTETPSTSEPSSSKPSTEEPSSSQSSSSSSSSSTVTVVEATKVTISGKDKIYAYQPGNTGVQLEATMAPENATNKKIVWSSSDETIATVDANGKVSLLKAGKVTITASAEGKESVKDTVEIYSQVAPTGIHFELNNNPITEITITEGKDKTPKIFYEGDNAFQGGKWSFEDKTIVEATAWNGLKALKAGTTNATFTSSVDDKVKATLKVTVEEKAVIPLVAGTFDFNELNGGAMEGKISFVNGDDTLVLEDGHNGLYLDNQYCGEGVSAIKFGGKNDTEAKGVFVLPEGYTKVEITAAEWDAGKGYLKVNGNALELTQSKKTGWDKFTIDIPADRKLTIVGTRRVVIDKFVLIK